MKNKKNIYLLLPIVLLIWGTLLYQFFTFTHSENETTRQKEMNLTSIDFKRDTFVISPPLRDPFLGKIFSTTIRDTSKSKPKKVILSQNTNLEIPWPTITYKGIVSDVNEKVKVFMVVINGKTFLMKKGDVENEIFLKDGDKEMIQLYYKKNLKLVFSQ